MKKMLRLFSVFSVLVACAVAHADKGGIQSEPFRKSAPAGGKTVFEMIPSSLSGFDFVLGFNGCFEFSHDVKGSL